MLKEKIVLINDLSPGDVLIMSVAIRSLHKAYPNKYITDVRSPSSEMFENNPYVQHIDVTNPALVEATIGRLKRDDNLPPILVEDTKYIISHYPLIHISGLTGLPFADGHRMFLAQKLGIDIPRTGMKPDIFFSSKELSLPRQVTGKYWIINAGIKNDYTLKYYPYYQEVVNLLKDKIQFVQVGHSSHNHPVLENVIDLRGKTTLRQLFLLSKYAEGAICPVSLQMVIMAALSKPCVVVAGAREGVRWQLNPDHRFLYTNGAVKCATYDGCWRSKIDECTFKSSNNTPMCMELIRPMDIARAVEIYYVGGVLKYDMKEPVILNLKGEIKVEKKDLNDNKVPLMFDREPGKPIKTDLNKEIICLRLPPEINSPQATSSIFNVLRILKQLNPTDTYLECYQGHYAKRKEKFMDTYHFMQYLGSTVRPSRILEIGTRTGTSICQLLSTYLNYNNLEKVVLCDLFNDGLATPSGVLNALKYLNIPVDKVQFIVGSSLDEIPKLNKNEKFDYILVDGNHDKIAASIDLTFAVELIAPGGYILFDDITPDGCSLQDVWDEFKGNNYESFTFMENHDGKGIGVAVKE